MWVKKITDLPLSPPEKITQWLMEKNNIGAMLRKVSTEMALRVLKEAFHSIFPDEHTILNGSSDCFIREIFLEAEELPLTFGRVVVPETVYLNYFKEFHLLGNKLIGETLLYNNPKTQRGPFEYQVIDNRHPLFNRVMQFLPLTFSLPSFLWARRSVFHMNGTDPLLITEIFFDSIPARLI